VELPLERVKRPFPVFSCMEKKLELGRDYDEYVEALPDGSLISIEQFNLEGKYVSHLKRVCLERGWNFGQGLRILLTEKIEEEYQEL